MIVVSVLRWLIGRISFAVEGRFPERFINLCAKNGINLWGLRGEGERITGCARLTDLRRLEDAAKKNGHRLVIEKKSGLPFMLKKHRTRCGLLAGLIISLGLWFYASGFIWNITLRLPDTINEYEMRATLREYGLYEGAWAKSINVDSITDSLCAGDKRISWMTINISGTDAEVNISPNLSYGTKKREGIILSNMVSAADGTVTRVNVYNGTAEVRAGDGIRRGQLLVSGVMEYTNGTSVLADSRACVYAKTARSVKIELPKTVYEYEPDREAEKKDVSLFGLCLPAAARQALYGERTVDTDRRQLSLLGHGLPLYFTCEKHRSYIKKPVELKLPQAEELLKGKLALYELFMLSQTNKGRVLNKRITVKEKPDGFVLEALYELEEDVCVNTVIRLDDRKEQEAPAR